MTECGIPFDFFPSIKMVHNMNSELMKYFEIRPDLKN